MIALLLGLALAKPAATGLEGISDDREQPTEVWFTEPVRPLAGYGADACKHDTVEWEVPAGVKADAHVIVPECGEPYIFLDLPIEGMGRTKWLRVLPGQVSTEPPKPQKWKGEPIGEAVIFTPSKQRKVGVTFDRPGEEATYIFFPYERVEVLDDNGLVRTVGGRLVYIDPHWVMAEEEVYSPPDPGKRAMLDRMVSTRAQWEEPGLIEALPPAEALLADPKAYKDRVFLLEYDLDDLHTPRYAREWVDPVSHEITRDCDRGTHRFEACGHYLFEYAPFGAWVPDAYGEVLARFDGVRRVDGLDLPVLTVLVKRPFQRSPAVSEEWAPRE